MKTPARTRNRLIAALLAVVAALGLVPLTWATEPPPVLALPPAPVAAGAPTADWAQREVGEVTPARVSYIHRDVSFWRPGGEQWAPAHANTPLAPGDRLYTGAGGNVEIQVGPLAFVRAAEQTQVGIDAQELDFLQLQVTAGHVALDLREVAAGRTVELDTPHGAFTVERPGYYRVDVTTEATTFITRRGGRAILTLAGASAMAIAANQQVVVTGAEAARVETVVASPELTAWDRWNYSRTDELLRSATSTYVPPDVYGAAELERHGTWHVVETYGPVWVPAGVPAGWVPYSAGRWIWDPRFGWTWLDDAPWGWAPYHYGRWVFVRGFWSWAPGPIVERPVYSPALVVFLGGPVVGRPICWAPLGWGEPLIPWWGRPGFRGVPWWGGWGGPRVVNNVAVNKTTVVNVQQINVYRNVNVVNAVVGVPAERFGRARVAEARLARVEVERLAPIRGAPDVRPVAASLAPATGPAVRPPDAVERRNVVTVRPARDGATVREREETPRDERRGRRGAWDERRDGRPVAPASAVTPAPALPSPQAPARRVTPLPPAPSAPPQRVEPRARAERPALAGPVEQERGTREARLEGAPRQLPVERPSPRGRDERAPRRFQSEPPLRPQHAERAPRQVPPAPEPRQVRSEPLSRPRHVEPMPRPRQIEPALRGLRPDPPVRAPQATAAARPRHDEAQLTPAPTAPSGAPGQPRRRGRD